MIPITDAVFLAAMLVLFVIVGPIVSRREMAGLRGIPTWALPATRLRSYSWNIAAEWIITAILLGWWLLMGRSAEEIGLHFHITGWQWLAVGVSLFLITLFAIHSHRAAGKPEELADVRRQLGDLALMTPHTQAELSRFGWLSVTAGICEEILYRGLLMTTLAGVIGLWPAVFASSVVFGISHAYQGASGMARSGGVGLVLALMVVFTGSLPTAMLVHALVDLTQGRLLWAAVNAPEADRGDAPAGCPQEA